MIKKLSATILVDDHSGRPELHCEHGFSIWLEADGHSILFDTGQSGMFIRNAESLGIIPHFAELLVLSHGHYDHTGGIPELLKRNSSLFVYCHPDTYIPRYSRQMDGMMKPIGINEQSENALNRIDDCVFRVTGPIYLSADMGITGPIPRRAAIEDTGGSFFIDPLSKNPDPVEDDQAMWFSTAQGLVVVTGCCHSGLINTISYIKSLTGNKPLHTVIGGLHLLRASIGRIESTCNYLQSTGIKRIMPCHCTGENAIEALKMRFGQKVEHGMTGAHFSFC
jgi:7,8-dihydropterin-6-yl-methyl-4-(beta-D-ribofuranosyl)aminobenzene 5'-phosphate synthase